MSSDKIKLPVSYMGNFAYDICVEDSFDRLEDEIVNLGLSGRKVCVVSETNVAPLYLDEVIKVFEKVSDNVTSFVFNAGEQFKTLDTVRELYTFLIEKHFDRNDFLVALGGGVTGDLTGYAAATYLRGVSFIQIPTTLLAQNDSSIGGKTGVDFDAYKNMVGAFHQPILVYINYNTLKTLDERVYLSGMGEVIKHGLIKNYKEYVWLKENADKVINLDKEALEHLLVESLSVKKNVVENDPLEKGERALLNFGHTIGHAIEKHIDFKLYHGECVAIGMVLAARISADRGFITEDDYNDIIMTLEKYKLPTNTRALGLSDEDIATIVANTKNDKKMDADTVKFVLLNQMGNAIVDRTVTTDIMKDVITRQN
ncbi:MAG: 3-dehydroquinate synthase [Lachnospiraceae bacterium]|nr:3-dehydroquinate synthase [Lachnospiraceae bacterium]